MLMFFSCNNEKNTVYNKLKGQWAIEELKYLNKNYKNNLYSNVLIFEDNNEVSIPESVHFKKDLSSSWSLKEMNNQILLNINSTNIVFNATFNINFIEDKERKLRGIILKSDTIYLKAFKLLQNYNDW